MKKTSRVSACLLTLALLLTLLPAGALAADAKGTTLRLEDTEGTVTIANARGKTLTTKSGAKLYNGYSVATSSASYAWISLDDDVVVKLDASSKATVKQDGKKLEVQLESGNLLFNVSKPLDAESSLDIRTSSMSTGVRGTAGLVSVVESSERGVNAAGETIYTYVAASQLIILEGTVTLTYDNAPVDGSGEATEAATAKVTSGWQVNVLKTTSVAGQDAGASSATDVKAEMQPVSLRDTLLSSGFAAVEIAADPALRERIVAADNDLDAASASEIVKEAETILKEEQQQAEKRAEEAAKAVEQALAETKTEMKQAEAGSAAVIPVFPTTQPENTGGSGSGGSEPAPKPTPSEWTVEFWYNDALYATQRVNSSGTAAAVMPSLRPTASGEWQLSGVAYDFTQAVKSDLKLTWIAQ